MILMYDVATLYPQQQPFNWKQSQSYFESLPNFDKNKFIGDQRNTGVIMCIRISILPFLLFISPLNMQVVLLSLLLLYYSLLLVDNNLCLFCSKALL